MTRCREVWVRFAQIGHQTVRISNSETASCAVLSVDLSEDNKILVIAYVNSAGQVLKTLTYNFNHVLDYSCEGVVG